MATEENAWGNLDHELADRRLRELFRFRGQRAKSALARVLPQDADQAAGGVLHQFEECLRDVHAIYFGTWNLQGGIVTPEVIRAVFIRGLLPLMDTDKDPLRQLVRYVGNYYNEQPGARDLIRAAVKRRLPDLRQRWEDWTEIQARELLYRGPDKGAGLGKSRVAQPNTPAVKAATPADKRNQTSLGPKKVNLSNYLDNAKLTEKQHTIASLNYEYGLSQAAIGRRLGVHRSVVQEQLIAVKKALGRDEGLQRYLKQQAAKGRSED